MGQRGGPNRAEFWLYKGVADKLVPNVVNYSTVPRHVLKYVMRKSNRAAEPLGEMRHFTQQCHLQRDSQYMRSSRLPRKSRGMASQKSPNKASSLTRGHTTPPWTRAYTRGSWSIGKTRWPPMVNILAYDLQQPLHTVPQACSIGPSIKPMKWSEIASALTPEGTILYCKYVALKVGIGGGGPLAHMNA